jgi:hypothetical protein
MIRQLGRRIHRSIVRPFATRRAVSAFVVLILLALQVFGAALASRPAAAFAPDRIEICTESGLMVLGHDGQPKKAPQADHNGHCLFCLPLPHIGAPPAPQGIFARLRPQEFLDFKVLASPPPAAAGIAPLAGAASPQALPVSV